MTNGRQLNDLERRLRATLERSASAPDPRLAERLLSVTAATPQRRRRSFLGFAGTALAAAAVVVLAIVAGLAIGDLPRGIGGLDTSGSPDAASSASPSPTGTATPTTTPSPGTSSASPSPTSEDNRCANDADGFSVRFPVGWHTNERTEQDFGDPIPACRYFGEEPPDILPNAGLPDTVAIQIIRSPEGSQPEDPSVEILTEEPVTVGGRPATRTEVEWTGDASPFFTEGDRLYRYVIELEDGETLVATTDSTAAGDYALHRAVLDDMMASLELE